MPPHRSVRTRCKPLPHYFAHDHPIEKVRIISGNHFFALYPPPEIRAALETVARTDTARGRPVPRERMHLTLSFLGERDGAQVSLAKDAAGGLETPAFTLRLDRLGYFYRKRLLWLGPSSTPAALSRLAKTLRERLLRALGDASGRPDTLLSRAPPFVPHVTLARRVPFCPLPRVRPVAWRVRCFTLMRSTPKAGRHVYEVLEEWPLR